MISKDLQDSVAQDQTALVVRGMFTKEMSKEVIERQEKTKLGQTEKKRIESLMNDRLDTLDVFLSQKVKPRIQVFTDYLEDCQSTGVTSLQKKKADAELRLEQLEAEKKEELAILTSEVEAKYAELKSEMLEESRLFTAKVADITQQHTRSVQRLKSRFDERLSQFKRMTEEVRQVMIEKLWTQATTLREGQLLLDQIPNSSTFMEMMEALAEQSGDEILKSLLTGTVAEKTEYFCDRCGKYDTVVEILHDGERKRPNGNQDYDHEENKGKKLMTCTNCKAETLVENMDSMRAPFRLKTHDVIHIGDDESSKILEMMAEGKV